MKKTVFLILSTSSIFANNNGYVPLSQFSEKEKIEYNFKSLNVPVKEENDSYQKVEREKEVTQSINKSLNINTVKKDEETVLEKNEQKEIIVDSNDKEIVIKRIEPIKLLVKEEKTTYNTPILSKSNIDDIEVDLRFEYSPVNAKYSLTNSSSINKSSDSFSPIVSLKNGNNILEFDYFMTDKVLETTWYKFKYKRKYNDIKVGLGINRYEISIDSAKASEDYLSFEIEQTKKMDKLYFNYGGSLGKNSDVDAYEYFFSVGLKNSEIFNSSYLLGFKSKTIKDNDIKITYSGPFIGVNTTF